MRTHYIVVIAAYCLISLSSCGGGKKVTNSSDSTTAKPVYEVHKANPAWASQELNDRESPAKSIEHEVKDDGAYLKVALHYSAPSAKGRTIWDSLVQYDVVWRTGANEANIIEFSNDVHIQDQHIQAGAYSLFTIPTATGWTVILNSETDQWGHYEYSEDSDVARFELPIVKTDFSESLSFKFVELGEGKLGLSFSWSDRGFVLPFSTAHDLDSL